LNVPQSRVSCEAARNPGGVKKQVLLAVALIKDGIPGTEMPETWQMSDREIREVAGYVRSLGLAELTPLPGSAASGKAVYAKAECARCHAVNGQGAHSGPT
jgi:mono/diheme cytochrome c family protein